MLQCNNSTCDPARPPKKSCFNLIYRTSHAAAHILALAVALLHRHHRINNMGSFQLPRSPPISASPSRGGAAVTAMRCVTGAPVIAISPPGKCMPASKTVLVGLVSLFVLGNLFCALALGYWTLMAASRLHRLRPWRVLRHRLGGRGEPGAAQPAGQRDRLMFAGLTLANILGVPADRWAKPFAGALDLPGRC